MSAPTATLESIIALLLEHDILGTEDPIDADSALLTLGLDSLAIMQLLLHLENHFAVTIPTTNLIAANFSTPTKLAEWMQQLQTSQGI